MAFNYKEELDNYMYENGKLTSVEQGERFQRYILKKLFNRTEDEIDFNDLDGGVFNCDGAGDRGIDCAFVDMDTLYIIQTKFRSTHKYDLVLTFKEQMESFILAKDAKNLPERLVKVWNLVFDDDINKVKIYYITNNELDDENEKYDYNKKEKEFSERIRLSVKKDISFNIIGINQYSDVRTGILLELPAEIKNAKSQFIIERFFENRDSNTIVAEVSLKTLAKIVKKHENTIFFSNIRDYKGLNKINKKMVETYTEHPKDFWFYNNGVTIVCKEYTKINMLADGSALIELVAPQIVNGCQTSTTIFQQWHKSSKKDQENLDGTILVKIIKDPKEQKRKEITKYTNSQTPVTGKDFFALENFHKELQNNFENRGYDYEIQSNAKKYKRKTFKGNAMYSNLFDDKFKKNNSFVAKDVVQLYVSCLKQNPGKAKNIGEYMPGGARYETVFDTNTPLEPSYYIIPYGVYYYLKNICDVPKKIDHDKWKASLLFTSSIFFKIVCIIHFNGDSKKYISDEFIKKCEEIISDKSVFEDYIDITKNVIVDFYKDTKIKEYIGDNLPKFLKSTIENNAEVISILNEKIEENNEM